MADRQTIRAAPATVRCSSPSPSSTRSSNQGLLYLRQYDELWARCYEQHIVTQSADPVLRRLLDDRRTRGPARMYVPYYWDDEDFRAVNGAIEDLWRRLRWIP
jgi:hypothetical protein